MAWEILANTDKRLKTILGIIASIGTIIYGAYHVFKYYETMEDYKSRIEKLESISPQKDSLLNVRLEHVENYVENEVIQFHADSTFQVGFRSDRHTLFYRDKHGTEYKLYRSLEYSTEYEDWYFYVDEEGQRNWVSDAHFTGWPGGY